MSAGLYGGGGYPGLPVSSTTAPPSSHTNTPTTLGVAASQAQSLGINPSSKSGQILRCCFFHIENNGRATMQSQTQGRPQIPKVHSLCLTFSSMGFQILYVTSCLDLDLVVRSVRHVESSRKCRCHANTILLNIYFCVFLANTVAVSRHEYRWQCCGSGSGIRCLFLDPSIWDPGWVNKKVRIRFRDPEWTTRIIFPGAYEPFFWVKLGT
jgi:hypothetical protein